MRYRGRLQKKRKGVKRTQNTGVLPVIPLSDGDTWVEVSTFDRLDNLAFRFYGDPHLWWIIASANNIGKGTMFITKGAIIRIPENTTQIINSLRSPR